MHTWSMYTKAFTTLQCSIYKLLATKVVRLYYETDPGSNIKKHVEGEKGQYSQNLDNKNVCWFTGVWLFLHGGIEAKFIMKAFYYGCNRLNTEDLWGGCGEPQKGQQQQECFPFVLQNRTAFSFMCKSALEKWQKSQMRETKRLINQRGKTEAKANNNNNHTAKCWNGMRFCFFVLVVYVPIAIYHFTAKKKSACLKFFKYQNPFFCKLLVALYSFDLFLVCLKRMTEWQSFTSTLITISAWAFQTRPIRATRCRVCFLPSLILPHEEPETWVTEVRTVAWFTERQEYNGPKTSFSSTLLRDESWVASELKTLELINIWSYLSSRLEQFIFFLFFHDAAHSLISGAGTLLRDHAQPRLWADGGLS